MVLLEMVLFLVIVLGAFPQKAQGDSTVNITGCKNSCILLPCNCTNKTDELKWQINVTLLYVNGSIFESEKYQGRIMEYLNEKKDCSIILNNITEEDNGSYLCSFYEGEIYSKNTVNLEVLANGKEVKNKIQCPDPKQDSYKGPPDVHTQMYFALLIIPALLLFGWIWIVVRKLRREKTTKQQFTALGTGTTPSSCLSQQDALNNV